MARSISGGLLPQARRAHAASAVSSAVSPMTPSGRARALIRRTIPSRRAPSDEMPAWKARARA
jgi:hypothetical protein